jgi:hypothetical protein
LYSFKNTLGSSPLLPLKIGITMLIIILSYKKHTKLINSFHQLSLNFYNLSSWIRKFPMAQIVFVIKFSLSSRCKSLKGPNISNPTFILFKCLDWKTTFTKSQPSQVSMTSPLHMTWKLLVLA